MINRIEHKADDSQVIGFAPKLEEETGLPILQQFPATSISAVIKYFNQNNENKAKNVYCLVAVPLNQKATPIVLCSFGCMNRFTYKHVMAR